MIKRIIISESNHMGKLQHSTLMQCDDQSNILQAMSKAIGYGVELGQSARLHTYYVTCLLHGNITLKIHILVPWRSR